MPRPDRLVANSGPCPKKSRRVQLTGSARLAWRACARRRRHCRCAQLLLDQIGLVPPLRMRGECERDRPRNMRRRLRCSIEGMISVVEATPDTQRERRFLAAQNEI